MNKNEADKIRYHAYITCLDFLETRWKDTPNHKTALLDIMTMKTRLQLESEQHDKKMEKEISSSVCVAHTLKQPTTKETIYLDKPKPFYKRFEFWFSFSITVVATYVYAWYLS